MQPPDALKVEAQIFQLIFLIKFSPSGFELGEQLRDRRDMISVDDTILTNEQLVGYFADTVTSASDV